MFVNLFKSFSLSTHAPPSSPFLSSQFNFNFIDHVTWWGRLWALQTHLFPSINHFSVSIFLLKPPEKVSHSKPKLKANKKAVTATKCEAIMWGQWADLHHSQITSPALQQVIILPASPLSNVYTNIKHNVTSESRHISLRQHTKAAWQRSPRRTTKGPLHALLSNHWPAQTLVIMAVHISCYVAFKHCIGIYVKPFLFVKHRAMYCTACHLVSKQVVKPGCLGYQIYNVFYGGLCSLAALDRG